MRPRVVQKCIVIERLPMSVKHNKMVRVRRCQNYRRVSDFDK